MEGLPPLVNEIWPLSQYKAQSVFPPTLTKLLSYIHWSLSALVARLAKASLSAVLRSCSSCTHSPGKKPCLSGANMAHFSVIQ